MLELIQIDLGYDAYIDKFFVAFILGSPGLISEHDIVIPPGSFVSVVFKNKVVQGKSGYRRLVSTSFEGMRRGLPRAMSFSLWSCSSAAFSRS